MNGTIRKKNSEKGVCMLLVFLLPERMEKAYLSFLISAAHLLIVPVQVMLRLSTIYCALDEVSF